MISAEGIDLTYEGIATMTPSQSLPLPLKGEGIDLTYEGIATDIQRTKRTPRDIEGIDLTYEGIATPKSLQVRNHFFRRN